MKSTRFNPRQTLIASLTTNPLVLVLLVCAVLPVVAAKRGDEPWARSVRAYLWLAAIVLGVRVVFQILLGGRRDGTVLFALPELALPAWAAGIRLGGPVSAEALAATLYDGLRLATLLVAVGAANALANPRRALRSVPPALADLSLAVAVALTVAPQVVESAFRVRRARRLRGTTRTLHGPGQCLASRPPHDHAQQTRQCALNKKEHREPQR